MDCTQCERLAQQVEEAATEDQVELALDAINAHLCAQHPAAFAQVWGR